jgi:kumamolisin
LKPNALVARRRSGVVVTIGTAGSLLLLGAGSAVAATHPPSPARVSVPQGIGPAALKTAHVVGQASASTKETVSFVLKPRNLAALESNVSAGMPHGNLSVAKFARTYGRSTAAIKTLTTFLAKHHIKSSVHADHLDVTTTGTVGNYNAALGVTQKTFRLAPVPASGSRPGRAAVEFHGTTQPLTLPAGSAAIVESILGLTSYPAGFDQAVRTPGFAHGAKPAATQTGSLKPANFASRYGLSPLLKRGFKGQGVTIGIVTLASMHAADATHFWHTNLKIKTKANRLKLENVDGGAGPVSFNAGGGETTLDVEQSGALAPDANIIVYTAPNTDAGFLDAFATAASQNKAGAVSSSWGESEDIIASSIASGTESSTYASAFDEMFLEMAAQGQSSFIASGDSGAYDSSAEGNCVFSTTANSCIPTTDLAVDNPGDSPWTTDAGGMTLAGTIPLTSTIKVTIKARRAWGWDWLWPEWKNLGFPSELAFIEAGFAGGDGGGFSKIEKEPSYQSKWLNTRSYKDVKYLTPTTPVSQNGVTLPTAWTLTPKPAVASGTGTGRAVPDVSADADPFTGYEEYFSKFPAADGGTLESGWGGTSFVAPQFAGATAVMDSFLHHRAGFWNPKIYRFAAQKNSPFDPVTTTGTANDNLFFTGMAGHRYNPAAGLGTPNFAKLAADFKR